jgi:hypothetical protein
MDESAAVVCAEPLLSVQLTVHLTVASSLVVAVTVTVIADGEVIVAVRVQLGVVPDPLQRLAKFAWATSTLTLTAPAASRPAAAA